MLLSLLYPVAKWIRPGSVLAAMLMPTALTLNPTPDYCINQNQGRSRNLNSTPGDLELYYPNGAIYWDEGRYMRLCVEGYGAYSNSLVIGCHNAGNAEKSADSHLPYFDFSFK